MADELINAMKTGKGCTPDEIINRKCSFVGHHRKIERDVRFVVADQQTVAPIQIGPTFDAQMLESNTSPTHQVVLNPFSFGCVLVRAAAPRC
jgi:hypothetical protein